MKGAASLQQGTTLCPRCGSQEGGFSLSSEQATQLKETHSLMLEMSMAVRSGDKTKPGVDSQELALDMQELNKGIGSLSSQESQHFRVMLLGLNEKLKTLELYQQKNKMLKASLRSSAEAQEQLHQSIRDSLNDNQRLLDQHKKAVSKAIDERNSLKDDLAKLQRSHRDKCNDEQQLLSKYKLLQSENDRLKAENKNFASMSELIASMQKQVKEQEEARHALRSTFQKSMADYESCKVEMDRELKKLSEENKAIGEKLQKSGDTVRSLENTRNDLQDKLTLAMSEISKLKSDINGLTDQAVKAKDMEMLAAKHHESIKQLNVKIQESSKEFSQEVVKLDEEKKKLLGTLKETKEELHALSEKHNSQVQDNDKLKEERRSLHENLVSVEERLCVQEDAFDLVDIIQDFKDKRDEFMDGFYNEIEYMTDVIVASSEQNLAHQRISGKLKECVQEKTSEIDLLREMIVELQKSKAYCPVKDDPIDLALAEYLNNRTDVMDVPFVREDQGVYLFGTKRVFMKLEHGKIILRVGGGYMHIDQFIDIYTPMEYDKMENRSSSSFMKDLNNDKIHLSPQKAARLIKKAMNGTSSNFAPLMAVPRKNKSPVKQRKSVSPY